MINVVQRIRDAAARRVAYHRTIREIESLPRHVAEDLGIAHEDARRLAERAVYG